MISHDEDLQLFLVDCHENLDALDRDLVSLEQAVADRAVLDGIFRTVHTIKGTCGMLGLTRLEALTHAGEDLLCRLQDGELAPDAEITTSLFALIDAIREILACLERRKEEGQGDDDALVETLRRLGRRASPGDRAATVATPSFSEPEHTLEPRGGVADSTIRVDVGLLDRLMNLVGELVLARNQILQYKATHEDPGFAATTQHINLITTELQEGVMKTRMQPIGNVWSKFPRVVRDLAMSCGKQIRIEMEGSETELDKTIVEAIRDPLTHIIRNAIDHGIEDPGTRLMRGKTAEGRLLLRAYHEGGQVNIEIADDGAGIDPDRIRQIALERDLISRSQADGMGDREAMSLIFLPGFTTAGKVSQMSGRGVGMDVVRTNIEKIGGTVDLQSRVGQGTTLKIKIPLTLAIIPALIVTCAGDRYAIPQVNLLELVRLEGEQALRRIEHIHGTPVYRLRGNLLPLVWLDAELQMRSGTRTDEVVNIVVLQADDRQFGLVVDTINDTEEIVVKPLSKQLKSIAAYAGATIMGDGHVALILDVLGLAQHAHVVADVRDRTFVDRTAAVKSDADQVQTLLITHVGHDRRIAIPLSRVARLEEFERDAVERVGKQKVVQYRGEILSLIDLAALLDDDRGSTPDADRPLQVVVYTEHDRSVGLVVDEIVDIVQESVTAQSRVRGAHLLGSAIIGGRVTDLLDVRSVVGAVDPSFFEPLVGVAS